MNDPVNKCSNGGGERVVKRPDVEVLPYNARAILLNNLSAAYATHANYEKAHKHLLMISELIPSDLISTKVRRSPI